MGVDEFQDKFTTEDNASFAQLEQKTIQELQRKYHWARGNPTNMSQFVLLGDTRMGKEKSLLLEDRVVKVTKMRKTAKSGKKIEHASTRFRELHDYNFDDGATEASSVFQPPSVRGYSFVVPPANRRDALAIELGREVEKKQRDEKLRSKRKHHKKGTLSKAAQELAKRMRKNTEFS